MNTHRVSVVGGNPADRRVARRLAVAAGLDVVESSSAPGERPPQAVLLHLPADSRAGVEEARQLIRDLAPTPVVALAATCGDGACSELRALGLAGCLPLSADDAETAQSLRDALAALERGEHTRCPHCPLGFLGEDAPSCTALQPGADHQEWTGHDTRGALCFPFVAVAPSMLEVERAARRAAASDATVLITGESGTGKEVLARYIHRNGSRAQAPFVKVNCAALPDQLLESEIFGYEKGAFTGAAGLKVGRFETAEGGIILLDEISEMSLVLQAKLLQVLEAKRFHRLGGLGEIEVDVQIIATTNRELEKDVASGRFRNDLYYRLRVIELHLPPLRERREDIPRLTDHFLCRLSRQHSQPFPAPSPTLRELVHDAPWPGNVRELENALRRLVVLGEEEPLLAELSTTNGRAPVPAEAEAPEVAVTPREDLNLKEISRRAAQEAEREAILAVLKETRWNRSQAAKRLGVSYKTLLTKMKDLLPPGA